MDYNDTYAGEFSYHNITRSQISIDKYNGQSNRVEIPEKISGQEVIEIGEGACSDNLILEHVQIDTTEIYTHTHNKLQNKIINNKTGTFRIFYPDGLKCNYNALLFLY